MSTDDDTGKKKQRSIEISKAVQKELEALPAEKRNQFLVALEQLSWDLEVGLPIAYLGTVGKGVAELKINGSPAYRLVYTTKFTGKVIVLAARSKSKQGMDLELIEVSASRLKSYS